MYHCIVDLGRSIWNVYPYPSRLLHRMWLSQCHWRQTNSCLWYMKLQRICSIIFIKYMHLDNDNFAGFLASEAVTYLFGWVWHNCHVMLRLTTTLVLQKHRQFSLSGPPVSIFTRGQCWPSGIVVACVCLCVCPSVRQSRACPRDNSWPVSARITKFGQ